ncbi:hypothetical protein CHU98_g3804 [Xylaria longipes]|nr:hypothetical protein CHU98_g3804 [Xylaria longipes]
MHEIDLDGSEAAPNPDFGSAGCHTYLPGYLPRWDRIFWDRSADIDMLKAGIGKAAVGVLLLLCTNEERARRWGRGTLLREESKEKDLDHGLDYLRYGLLFLEIPCPVTDVVTTYCAGKFLH